jgi:hypothetical protein
LSLGAIAFLSFSYPSFEKVKSFKILKINSIGTFDAEAIIEVRCDNWFSFSGKNIEFNMYYGDSLVSSGQIPEEITFKSGSLIELPMKCNFDPSVFGEDLETILFKDTVIFKGVIQGDFTMFNVASSKEMEVKLPMSEMAGSIVSSAMSESPIVMDSLSIESVSLSRTKVSNIFVFENSMQIDYTINDIEFSVYSDSEEENKVSEGLYEINQIVKVGEKVNARGSIEIDNVTSVLSGLNKMRKGDLVYYLSGIAHVKISDYKVQVPISQKFKINPISRKIEMIK